MKAGDVTFEKSGKTRHVIYKVIDLSIYGGLSTLYRDIVGMMRRVKTDRRSAIGKTRPEYTWEVHLEKEPIRRFNSEAEAKEWTSAVLKLD